MITQHLAEESYSKKLKKELHAEVLARIIDLTWRLSTDLLKLEARRTNRVVWRLASVACPAVLALCQQRSSSAVASQIVLKNEEMGIVETDEELTKTTQVAKAAKVAINMMLFVDKMKSNTDVAEVNNGKLPWGMRLHGTWQY